MTIANPPKYICWFSLAVGLIVCSIGASSTRRRISHSKFEKSLFQAGNRAFFGKTSLVNVIVTGGYSEDMIPTVGFNMRTATKGNVTIKLWDIGGQPRFRSMWERYCRAVSAIVKWSFL